MSLLLDALRRAEQDSKKRKLAEAEPPVAGQDGATTDSVAANVPGAPASELTLEVQSPAPELTLDLEAEPEPTPVPQEEVVLKSHSGFGGGEAAPDASFLDFELPSDDAPLPVAEAVIPASLAPRKSAHPYGRYDRPAWEDSNSNWGALTAHPIASRRSASDEAPMSRPAPIKPGSRRAAAEPPPERERSVFSRPIEGATPAQPPRQTAPASSSPVPAHAATPRQALSAAGVMAGRKKAVSGDSRGRRRQMVLAGVALLVALPLIALLLFGDALFGSSSIGRVAVNSPSPPAPVAATPVPAEAGPTTAVPAPFASAPVDPVTAAMVAVPAEPPASPPPQAVTAERVTSPTDATPRGAPPVPARSAAPRSVSARAARPASAGAAAPPAATLSSAGTANRPASLMDSAYAAYQAGNTVEASRLYREVLKADATQRDAWLGLAVIAHANNQLEPAMDAYRRVLRLEPQNATALAGVSSLSRAAGEPQQESRLRELLARSPQEADLNHALALVLSGEQRWSEAQPLFFKAHALAPKEPQFAYNLAVTLDHMRKSSLAAQYYETALGLAQGKAAGFDEANARTRLAALRAAR